MIKNKLMKSKATILTPREPLSLDKSEILDIRITTAASGKGEKAIRRLKYFLFPMSFYGSEAILSWIPSPQNSLPD